jgi:hypothetical protein
MPMDLVGCHMLMIDGYVVEGHVSAAAVKQLLNRVQFENRSTNLPRPPRERRSELESTGFKLDAV